MYCIAYTHLSPGPHRGNGNITQGPAGMATPPHGLAPPIPPAPAALRMSAPPIRGPAGRDNSAEGRDGGKRPVVPKLIAAAKSTGSEARAKVPEADELMDGRLSVILGAGGGDGSPWLKSGTGELRIDDENPSRDPIPVLDVIIPKSLVVVSEKPLLPTGPISCGLTPPKPLAALLSAEVRLESRLDTELGPKSPNGPPPPLPLSKPELEEPPKSPSEPELPDIKRLCRSNSTSAGLLLSVMNHRQQVGLFSKLLARADNLGICSIVIDKFSAFV